MSSTVVMRLCTVHADAQSQLGRKNFITTWSFGTPIGVVRAEAALLKQTHDALIEQAMAVTRQGKTRYLTLRGKALRYRRIVPAPLRQALGQGVWSKTYRPGTAMRVVLADVERLAIYHDCLVLRARAGETLDLKELADTERQLKLDQKKKLVRVATVLRAEEAQHELGAVVDDVSVWQQHLAKERRELSRQNGRSERYENSVTLMIGDHE